MKSLYCQDCGDIIAPYPRELEPRFCRCKRHAVWWVDPSAGVLRVCDTLGRDGQPGRARAWVLGFTNLWLQNPAEDLTADDYREIVEAHDDYYLFKKLGSVAIRIRPGMSSDTRWAPLPNSDIKKVEA